MSYYFDGNLNDGQTNQFYNGRIIDTPKPQHNQTKDYTSVPLDPEFDWDLTGSGDRRAPLSSTIHPFIKKKNRVYGQFKYAVKPMLSIRNARRTFLLLIINFVLLFFMFSWCSSSSSLALRAYAYQSVFDVFTLVTCLISIWIISKQQSQIDETTHFFSYVRLELLFVFSSAVLSILASIFVLKECLSRFVDQPDIAIGRLIPAAFFGLLFHTGKMMSIQNKAFQSVTEASSSSVIQEHVADMSHGLCSVVPGLGRILLPRVDPFFLASFIGAAFLLLTDLLIQIDAYYFADTVSAFLIAIITVCTMWPIVNCSARVLLNTTPPFVLAQLDKLLSEAQTLDGVLEIRQERFYTMALSPPKLHNDLHQCNSYGLIMAGSVQVRVRRDANEQMVLAHVTNRLSPLVANLTVQIVKDDWASTGTLSATGISGKTQIPNSSSVRSQKAQSSTIIYGFNKPAAAVVPYQQTPPKPGPQTTPIPIATTNVVSQTVKVDDFSFQPTSSKPAVKPKVDSTPGSNIARMYKAAGYTSPPQIGGTIHNKSTNLSSKTSFEKLPATLTAPNQSGKGHVSLIKK